MLDIRVDFGLAEEKIQKSEKDPSKAKVKKRKSYRRTGRKFFERYELAIRHHQAVHGNQPVFERFWHFWGNHFAIIDKNKLPDFNTGPMQREQLRPLMTGRFADMVYDMTLTWPMMKSLDNFKSRGPNSDYNIGRRKRNKPEKGLNENHGRELLELLECIQHQETQYEAPITLCHGFHSTLFQAYFFFFYLYYNPN
jgi:uncharacterized protein (DUF1800 family)